MEQNTTRIQELHGVELVETLASLRNKLETFRKQVDERFGTDAADPNSLKRELNQKVAQQNLNPDERSYEPIQTTRHLWRGNFGVCW
ncbi:MAG: hypothetical protein ABI378_01850 [Chitinophagaceae bacterium]